MCRCSVSLQIDAVIDGLPLSTLAEGSALSPNWQATFDILHYVSAPVARALFQVLLSPKDPDLSFALNYFTRGQYSPDIVS